MPKIVIAAGGTGGHVFPALAVAQALKKQQIEVCWLGTRLGLESRVIPAHGFCYYKFNIKGLRGKSKPVQCLNLLRLAWAGLRSFLLLLWLRPKAVLIMGGYIGAAVGLAARLLRVPILVHEQNAIAGMTNKVIARVASQVMAAFPDAFPPGTQVRLTGNPVREDILLAAKSVHKVWDAAARPLRL